MRLPRTLLLSASACALTIGAAACSSSDGSPDASDTDADVAATAAPEVSSEADGDAAAGGSTVGIFQSRFDPTEIEISAGETVTFVNNDPFAHTVTSKDDSAFDFDSGNFGQDETFDVEFAEPGTYDYFCQIHPTMRASVTVT